MLSEAALRQLSHNNGGDFQFDFSTINAEHYERLFRTLQRFCLKNVDSIRFSCDELAKCEQRVLDGKPLPSNVANSIAKKKIHYIRNMVELLCYVSQKSQRLADISFSNLTMRKEHLQRLSTAFGTSNALKSLTFSRVLLEDDGIRILLNSLDPNKIEKVAILKCGITGACTEDIVRFIGKRRELGTGLQSFEVSTTEIPDADRRRIKQAVDGTPASPTAPATPRRKAMDELDSEDSMGADRRERINELKSENRSLREQIRALKEMHNAVKFNDSVFVIGKGAPEFVSYLNEVEQRLVALDSR